MRHNNRVDPHPVKTLDGRDLRRGGAKIRTMSAKVHSKRKKKMDLRAGAPSAPAFAPLVPTVTLISHREPRDKHAADRLQAGSLDLNQATSSYYRCSEGRNLFYEISWQCVTVMSDGWSRSCQVCSLSRSD